MFRRFLRGSLGPAHYVFAGIVLLRVVTLLRLTASPSFLPNGGDMQFYTDWAQRIASGRLTDYHAFYGLPLYAYFLALLFKFFGSNPFAPSLLQACAEGLTGVIMFKLARQVFGAPRDTVSAVLRGGALFRSLATAGEEYRGTIIGVLAAFGWAVFLPAQAYAAALMPTAWMALALWFIVWRIVNGSPERLTSSLVNGLVIGFTSMGVATILFAIPLLIAAIAFARSTRLPERFTAVAILIFGVTLGSAPCWLHNAVVARDPVFLSAHSGVNLWVGNNPEATGYPHFPDGLRAGQAEMLQDSTSVAENAAGHSLKRSEVSAFWSAKAKSFIREEPRAWLGLLGRKLANFWNAFQYDDIGVITRLRDEGVLLPGFGFGLAAALALPGLCLAWSAFPSSRWIAGAIFLQMLAVMPVFVTERYRLPVVPGLLLFAAYGIWRMWKSLLRTDAVAALTYAVLLGLATTAVSMPRRDPALSALDAYQAGRLALEAGEFPLAQSRLQLALAYAPANVETNLALGNLQAALHHQRSAESFYQTALKLDPKHTSAWNNQGVLALDEQHWEVAITCFTRALELSPGVAKTRYLLAKAKLGGGDTIGAKAEVEKALKIAPARREFLELKDEIARASLDRPGAPD